MPFRIDLHAFRQESSPICADRKAASQSPTYPNYTCDHVMRPRSRRTRLTSSGHAADTNLNVQNECGSFRTRRASNLQNKSISLSQQSKSHLKSTSPTSVLDSYASERDTTSRVEQLEDDNSFSSSVFSEHMAHPDLPLVLDAVANDSGKSCGDDILSSEHTLLNVGADGDDNTNGLVTGQLSSDIKADVTGMLIHEDSGVSTPMLVAADDCVSSEGEEDNNGRERSLMLSPGTFRLGARPEVSSNLASDSEPCLLTASCVPSSMGLNTGLTEPSSFDHISAVPNLNVPRVDGGSGVYSNSMCTQHNLSCQNRTTEQVASVCSLKFRSHGQALTCATRVITRSQTAELFRSGTPALTHFSSARTGDTRICDNEPRCDIATTCLSAVPQAGCGSSFDSLTLSSQCNNHYTKRGRDKPLLANCIVHLAPISKQNELTASNLDQHVSKCHCSSDSPIPAPKWDFVTKEEAPCPGVSTGSVSPRRINADRSGFPARNSAPYGTLVFESETVHAGHPYLLRSRLRREYLRREWLAARASPKSFNQLPTEVLLRIVHYLCIQDLFRLQLVSSRFKALVERYLLLVKRINFSNGLPFAFLPSSINDSVLRRILSHTPEVTHILGFYPKTITGSHPLEFHSLGNNRTASPTSLTYAGIVSAFRLCPKLRSVELMDVELMSKLVHYLPRIKFHGMFRNRPDSWDCEYAVPLPIETKHEVATELVHPRTLTNDLTASSSEATGCLIQSPTLAGHLSSLFCCVTAIAEAITSGTNFKSRKVLDGLTFKCLRGRRPSSLGLSSGATFSKNSSGFSSLQASTLLAHQWSMEYADLAAWLDLVGEFPVGHGSPSTVPHFLPCVSNGSLSPWLEDAFQQAGFSSSRSLMIAPFLQPGLPPVEAELIAAPLSQYMVTEAPVTGTADNPALPLLGFAFGALFVSPDLVGQGLGAPFLLSPQSAGTNDPALVNQSLDNCLPNVHPNGRGPSMSAASPHSNQAARVRQIEPPQPIRIQPNDPGQAYSPNGRRQPVAQYTRHTARPWFASPLPWHSVCIGLPFAIANLTKLDLVSVTISALPRMDNIKYLHLKWVMFTAGDPFFNFSAPKLQSFVMNNCIGPSRVVRFVRIFSALAGAPQLTRLELIGVRFLDGLLVRLIDVPLLPGRAFRNLQRLVLSSNKEATEFDVGLLLLAGQQSLNHVALQVAHTRDSLFQSLACAQARFPRLENLILGYQDPYQSRLTVSELTCLGIGDSPDHLMPLCYLNDHGLALVFDLCPRLVNLSIRHSPYLSSIAAWCSPSRPSNSGSRDDLVSSSQRTEDDSTSTTSASRNQVDEASGNRPATSGSQTASKPISHSVLPLRSLTLENCPGISVESIEEAISTVTPFPCLETLVLRDMFVQRSGSRSALLPRPSWSERLIDEEMVGVVSSSPNELPIDEIDWRKLSHLQALSDLLAVRRLGPSPVCPEGVGLASSAREVTTAAPPAGARAIDMPIKQFDLFHALRIHHYLNSLLELDGSCGPRSVGVNRIRNALFRETGNHCSSGESVCSADPLNVNTEFVSQSTQTCICGILEWNLFQCVSSSHSVPSSFANSPPFRHQQRSPSAQSYAIIGPPGSHKAHPSASVPCFSSSPHSRFTPASTSQQRQQLGGPLAFHPFPPSVQHHDLHKLITCSSWAKQVARHPAISSLSSSPSLIHVDSGECLGCASDPLLHRSDSLQVSARHQETALEHRTRTWLARDATVDTAELRCHTASSQPLVLTIYQPPFACHSNLTSIHFEKVGISHLVLSGAPHLKNITLENCPQLQAILFNHWHTTSEGDTRTHPHSVPSLRRIRVIRCPKFAIFHLLHAVSALYPAHDENISITYRPFGRYNEQVERALWLRAHHAHVLVSHDYKQHESERQMEEFHSTFDQLFREVINFADMLMRRELLSPHPKPSTTYPVPSNFRRSEHGVGWNLVTDIPWIHEICCSLLRNTETRRSDQADQFYEVLSEIQAAPRSVKLQRRGIHLHVQYRDVHDPFSANSTADCAVLPSYHNWDYSEQYLMTTLPLVDLNAWGDGFDELVISSLPPLPKVVSSLDSPEPTSWQQLLLRQEEIDIDTTSTRFPVQTMVRFRHREFTSRPVLRKQRYHARRTDVREEQATKKAKLEQHLTSLYPYGSPTSSIQRFCAPCPAGTRKRTSVASTLGHTLEKKPRTHTP
ncbi:unnamed protein product [Dicrocoelium dendriticum]|nr:unnamed protein product [Dicrocoelium dendriticum]